MEFGNRGGRDFVAVCLCVCLSFFRTISTTDAGRITKLDMYKCSTAYDSWKPIYFGVKKSKVKVTRHKTVPEWGFSFL